MSNWHMGPTEPGRYYKRFAGKTTMVEIFFSEADNGLREVWLGEAGSFPVARNCSYQRIPDPSAESAGEKSREEAQRALKQRQDELRWFNERLSPISQRTPLT
ncbi:MAG: hypothetical protein UR22_C0009G0027 [Parcubacteria group bacterium GW2011_GWC2_32_10]|nr:MAG: hypothetical protein UR22_C0009G0027 [Parcubacteria group bacterium GW2011_GWC2_32_10]